MFKISAAKVLFLFNMNKFHGKIDHQQNPVSANLACVEDARWVEDPTLFERPCKWVEDLRSLVRAGGHESASKRNFNGLLCYVNLNLFHSSPLRSIISRYSSSNVLTLWCSR